MVTMHRGQGWKIAVYAREHGVPHFHIEGPDYRCSVSIETLDAIIGTAPAGVMRSATGWARTNRPALLAKWKELNL
jgi:hypothetical protein